MHEYISENLEDKDSLPNPQTDIVSIPEFDRLRKGISYLFNMQ